MDKDRQKQLEEKGFSTTVQEFLGLSDDDMREIETMIGEGCVWCAMTGFEDYPSNNKPCRLGHPDFTIGFGPLPPLPEPVEDRPTVGGPWKWTGRGWDNLGHPAHKNKTGK